jgi:hypothetical protein
MSTRPTFSEHDSEPVPGLPGMLPPGETLLWQGSPRFAALAKRAMHLRGLTLYFAALAVWRAAVLTAERAPWPDFVLGIAWMLLLGAVPIGLLALYAWASARSTIYSITSRRVVVRTGVALPMTVNIPFAVIGGAALAQAPDGTGDIALDIMPPHRVSWIALWPHTRSWRITRPQPALRGLAEPEAVARLLARALAASAAMPVQPIAAPGTASDDTRIEGAHA